MDAGSVRGCAERIANARLVLESGAGGEELIAAAEMIGILSMADFPPDLRLHFARIYEAISAEGDFYSSVRAMSPARAAVVRAYILDLAAIVGEREELENPE